MAQRTQHAYPTSHTVQRETTVLAPAAIVWEVVTKADQLRRWLGAGEVTLEPRVQGVVRLQWPQGLGGKGSHVTTVTGRLLSYVRDHELRVACHHGWVGTVAVRLLPGADGGTLVRVTHEGLPEPQERRPEGRWWTERLESLKQIVDASHGSQDPRAAGPSR